VPLFPSTIGHLPVDWAVPIDKVTDEANWIYSWARQPGTHWSNVLGKWDWFRPWLEGFLSKRFFDAILPLCLSALFMAMTFAVCRFGSARRPRCLEWAILLPPVVGLLYWFFTAPDPRFATALFFILCTCSLVLLLLSVRNMTGRRVYLVLLCIAFTVANCHLPKYLKNSNVISLSGWHPVRNVPLDIRVTSSGLSVYTPRLGYQCWDSPLPSTPRFEPRLRLRTPGRMASGFTITKEDE
jgi:hypothetical protein